MAKKRKTTLQRIKEIEKELNALENKINNELETVDIHCVLRMKKLKEDIEILKQRYENKFERIGDTLITFRDILNGLKTTQEIVKKPDEEKKVESEITQATEAMIETKQMRKLRLLKEYKEFVKKYHRKPTLAQLILERFMKKIEAKITKHS